MKIVSTLLLAFCCTALAAQSSRVQVMTLGSFHFNFPNLDVVKTGNADQIDVLEPRYQKEIEAIVGKIAQ